LFFSFGNLNTLWPKILLLSFLDRLHTLTFALPYPTGKGFNNFFNQKNRVMNNNELMVIFTPVLSDDEFKAAQKKFTTLVTDNGGSIVGENPWGLKSLAYPIQKKTTGLYWVTEFIAPSDFNEKLKIQLLRDESVLRHMVTKLDKYAVEYNQKKRSGVPTGTEKVQEG
jgi:small subunit ribosomal protein S6